MRFSRGNLQYTTTGTHTIANGSSVSGTWRFAEDQWIFLGYGNQNPSPYYNGWIDLFGWGTSGYNNSNDRYDTRHQPYDTNTSVVNSTYNYYGYGPSTNMTDPSLTGTSANYDWGVYNAISNGGNQPGLWRTLTQAEWDTLITHRTTASGIRFAKATVNSVPGIIIVPDNWDTTTYALDSTNIRAATFTSNTITSTQWPTLENAGCAFLPAAGSRRSSTMLNIRSHGYYWSTTYHDVTGAYCPHFDNGAFYSGNQTYAFRYSGFSVRLVLDIIR